MLTIPANNIKKQGISVLGDEKEALITVRGQPRYVIVDIQLYEALREKELTAALMEAKEEIKQGKYVCEPPAEHVKRVTKSKD